MKANFKRKPFFKLPFVPQLQNKVNITWNHLSCRIFTLSEPWWLVDTGNTDCHNLFRVEMLTEQ